MVSLVLAKQKVEYWLEIRDSVGKVPYDVLVFAGFTQKIQKLHSIEADAASEIAKRNGRLDVHGVQVHRDLHSAV